MNFQDETSLYREARRLQAGELGRRIARLVGKVKNGVARLNGALSAFRRVPGVRA